MIAIVTAMQVELERIVERMDEADLLNRPGLRGYVGLLEGHDVVAAVCGVGKVCAAQCTQLLISGYYPTALLHSGVAGAVAPGLKPLDVVVARELTYRDMEDKTKRDFLPFGGNFVADAGITALLRQACPESHLGCVATGDRFVSDPAEKQRLLTDYNALCAEMEGAAVAHVCTVNWVPFGVVRCISDLADGGAQEHYARFEREAARKSADILCNALRRMP